MNTQTSSNTQDEMTIEWLEDEQITIYTLRSVSREAIDKYIDAVVDMAFSTPADTATKVIHDYSHRSVMITPYFKKRMEDANTALQKQPVSSKTAIIMSSNILGTTRRLITTAFNLGKKDTETRFFSKREEAIDWLQES